MSTEEQAADRVSLAAQREKVRGIRQSVHDLELVGIVEDAGESAAEPAGAAKGPGHDPGKDQPTGC